MDILVKIGAFLGFLAFFSVGSLTSKVNKLIREGRAQAEQSAKSRTYTGELHMNKETLARYIGSPIGLDFFEDEGDGDLFFENDALLLAVDEKWALLEINKRGQKKRKMIRLSSIKGISAKL